MSNKKIIALAGCKYSGKSTIANGLLEHYGSNIASVESFATPIKSVSRLLGFIENAVYGDEKESWIHPAFKCSYRKFAQLFGTEFARDMFNKNVWIDLLIHKIDDSSQQVIIIDDVRFPEEANSIRNRFSNSSLFKIIRSKNVINKNDKHSSERPLPNRYFDAIITNDTTISDAVQKIVTTIESR